MDFLPMNFCVFRLCGAWKKRKESNLIIRFASFCHRYAIVISIYYFTASMIIRLVHIRNNIEELMESLFITLTFVHLCLKYTNFLARQFEVRALLDSFHAKLCQPKNSAEESILKRYSRKANQIAWFYMILCQMTGLFFIISPVLASDKRPLPYKVYVPYSIAPLFPYVLTYIQQATTLTCSIALNTSCDTLIYGLIIYTCGQIELLCHRMMETFRYLGENEIEARKINAIENVVIAECVKHHISMYNIIYKIQSLFVWTVAILFFFSLVTLCTTIYQMSKKNLFSLEFITLTLYLGAMLFQTFLYCWYSNELDLKAKYIAHAIYASNWTVISAKQRKSLLLVMMISQRGKILSTYGIFALLLSTFTWILKTSYAAFNLLQQTSS
ncbi:odorant receptor 46a-like [Harpegnathos saltator]|uniref:odorant receptor 46a-like n=1 Tax=Harpegnathos saltator TaxID=610380 RepID=UPI000948B233|nr:odorant receptor 46a-like [Harpegnathos saltator]